MSSTAAGAFLGWRGSPPVTEAMRTPREQDSARSTASSRGVGGRSSKAQVPMLSQLAQPTAQPWKRMNTRACPTRAPSPSVPG